jgi:hypothetical protein
MGRLALSSSLVALLVSPILMLAAVAPATPAGGGAAATPVGGAAPARGGGQGRGRGPVSPTTPVLGRGYMPRHTDFLQIARRGAGNIDVLFVGDSITDFWLTTGREVWDKNFEPLKAANFGISGDTTQSALWRMQNGELEGFKAKAIILMLGTNNINSAPNDQIAEGQSAGAGDFPAG